MIAISLLFIESIRFWSVDRNWFLCFSETVLQYLQWVSVRVSMNGCCHNAPKALNHKLVWWISWPILWCSVVFNICIQPRDCSLFMYAHKRHLAETFLHDLSQCLSAWRHCFLGDIIMLARINRASNGRLWYFVYNIVLNYL